MRKTFLLIIIMVLLTSCNKTDQVEYESLEDSTEAIKNTQAHGTRIENNDIEQYIVNSGNIDMA